MHFVRRSTALLAVLAVESTAVLAVHRLGSRPPFDLPFDQLDPWLRASPEDAFAAALRGVALGCAWWLLVVTVAYACACMLRVPAAVRACEWAIPSTIRHTVNRALVASIVVSAVATPLGASAGAATPGAPSPTAPPPSVVVDVRDGRSLESLPAETAPASPEPAPPEPASVPVDAPFEPSFTVVVVTSGDSLWGLSAAALARATGRVRAELADDEIARYWSVVCDANRSGLRSGDVNLIFPGEVVVLPSASP